MKTNRMRFLTACLLLALFAFVGSCQMEPIDGNGLIDIDGNSYNTVIIGEQEWMSENLNVSHFRNGDTIPFAETSEQWLSASKNETPAWCYYRIDTSDVRWCGRLYNWYAVSDERGLAPEGWKVPSIEDFYDLQGFLSKNGYAGLEGNALKNPYFMEGEGGKGLDAFGFNGQPCGHRYFNGAFDNAIFFGYFWSASETDSVFARDLVLSYKNPIMNIGSSTLKTYGFSVRCLKLRSQEP